MPLDFAGLHRPIGRYFRRKRFSWFEREFQITRETTILDVGGTEYYWQWFESRPRVTILNFEARDILRDRLTWVRADGRKLPFADRAFDVVFCNSVIEHLPDQAARTALAGEIRRVGRSFLVQTPNRYFPIEAHLLTPFFHYLPKPWQSRLAPNFTLWGRLQRPTAEEARGFVEHIHLLSARDLARLFPGASIQRERFLGLTKSVSAVRKQS